MRLRFLLGTVAVVVLVTGLTLGRRWRQAPNPYVLQVPATYLSVGQQFEPRLVSLAPGKDAATDSISIELRTSTGQALDSDPVTLAPGAVVAGMPLALPREGSYELRASSPAGTQTIMLRALPEPPPDLAGVLPLTALGLAPGVADYLRSHGFVVSAANVAEPAAAATRVIVLGNPWRAGEPLARAYAWLWNQVAGGAQALLLQPPPPAAATYWPLAPALLATRAGDGCGADTFASPFTDGLTGDDGLRALLRPRLRFDYSGDATVALYHWNGLQIFPPRKDTHGYPGCHALVSYRLGEGWVTQSTLPLLEHFQDVRARVVLMNLIMAAARRKHRAPASPGLAWVMRERMKTLGRGPEPAVSAVYYRAPPAAVESAPELAPVADDGNPRTCLPVAANERAGANFTLELGGPRALHTLALAVTGAPPLRLEGTRDGRQWTALPLPAAATGGEVPVSGQWTAFRLSVAAPASAWGLCQFAAR